MAKMTTGEALARLRERAGMTLADIASAAGYKGPSSVQMMFSPDYTVAPLSLPVANKLARALVGKGAPPITLAEITALCYGDVSPHPTELAQADFGYEEFFRQVGGVSPPVKSRDIPVFGTALAADLSFDDEGRSDLVEQTVFEMGETILYVRRPAGLAPDAEAYGLYVSGSSMEPRYRPGDPLVADPKRPPSIGDDVVVQLISAPDGEPDINVGLIKTLVRRTGSFLELEQYHPPIRFRVPMERVARIHRVIPPKELLGF